MRPKSKLVEKINKTHGNITKKLDEMLSQIQTRSQTAQKKAAATAQAQKKEAAATAQAQKKEAAATAQAQKKEAAATAQAQKKALENPGISANDVWGAYPCGQMPLHPTELTNGACDAIDSLSNWTEKQCQAPVDEKVATFLTRSSEKMKTFLDELVVYLTESRGLLAVCGLVLVTMVYSMYIGAAAECCWLLAMCAVMYVVITATDDDIEKTRVAALWVLWVFLPVYSVMLAVLMTPDSGWMGPGHKMPLVV